MEEYLLFFDWIQASCFMQQASRPSQGFSPGHPLYRSPQYLPYLKNGGTAIHISQRKFDHRTKRIKPKYILITILVKTQ